ncbi:hypothetical protein ACJX0J_035848, partial [Zea mays]
LATAVPEQSDVFLDEGTVDWTDFPSYMRIQEGTLTEMIHVCMFIEEHFASKILGQLNGSEELDLNKEKNDGKLFIKLSHTFKKNTLFLMEEVIEPVGTAYNIGTLDPE